MTFFLSLLPSGGEWFWIGLVALLFFGPNKLPEMARMAGRWMGELQRARRAVEEQLHEIERESQLPVLDVRPAASTRPAQLQSQTHPILGDSSKDLSSSPAFYDI